MMIPLLSFGLLFCVLWLAGLTWFFRRMQHNYVVFTNDMNRKTLDGVLSALTKQQGMTREDIAKLTARCDTIEKNERFHIQKIGLLRFNPFKDTGGDQSFILSMVDAHDTGIIITALYSRSGTRWYTKRVVRGKGSEHELSEEEKKALKLAQQVQ